MERNHLFNFERGNLWEQHSCKVISNLDKWFRRRCHLKKKVNVPRMPDGHGTKTDHNTTP